MISLNWTRRTTTYQILCLAIVSCISKYSIAQIEEQTQPDSLVNKVMVQSTESLSDSIVPPDQSTSPQSGNTANTIKQDSLHEDFVTAPKVENNGYGIFSMFQGNPGKAGLMSLIIPGLGQAYNKRWWKIPVAIGAEVTVLYLLRNNIKEWEKWDADYRGMVKGAVSENNPNLSLNAVRNIRNAARQNRDYTWLGLIGAHIIIAADAFVDRHLIEFDVDDDLSFKASPLAPYPGLNIVMTF